MAMMQTLELNFNEQIHEYDMQINDLQMAPDRTYFITAGKDKTAKVYWIPRLIISCKVLTPLDCLLSRPFDPQDICRRHPSKHGRDHAKEGLCHTGRRPSRDRRHNDISAAGEIRGTLLPQDLRG